jgi:Protein of unknown function (DUF3040)
MTLSYHQQRQLRRIEADLLRSDPDLAAIVRVFSKLSRAEDMPAEECVPQEAAGQGRLRRAASRIVAVLTQVAAATTWPAAGTTDSCPC